MKIKYTLAILLLLVSRSIYAQTPYFLNGSLEPSMSSTVVKCYDNPFYQINTLGHVWMTIVGPQRMMVMDSNCGQGYAKTGNYFLGMHYSPTLHKGSQLLLEVTPPLLAGNTYYFAFYYRGVFPVTGTGAALYYGYSTKPADSVYFTSDSLLKGGMRLTSSTTWTHAIVAVNPSITTSYIWAAISNPDAPNDSLTVFVDDFSFDLYEGIGEKKATSQVQLFPNPAHHTTLLQIPESAELPCAITVTDVTGRTVIHMNTQTNNTVVDCKELARGIYILKLTDKENKLFIQRLEIE